jgi:hypothetical protein
MARSCRDTRIEELRPRQTRGRLTSEHAEVVRWRLRIDLDTSGATDQRLDSRSTATRSGIVSLKGERLAGEGLKALKPLRALQLGKILGSGRSDDEASDLPMSKLRLAIVRQGGREGTPRG